jgi:hypothetical protein
VVRGLRPGRALGDELEDRYLGHIALAHPGAQDARVATPAFLEGRRDLVEQLLEHGLVVDERRRLTPRVQIPPLPQGDHALVERPLPWLGGRGRDAFVAQERGDHVAQHGTPMGWRLAQLRNAVSVSHDS